MCYRNKKPHTSNSNSAFQNLSVNTNISNVSSNQSQFSGSHDLKENLDELYQGYFSPNNFTGYPTDYQMTVPPQTFWQGQTISSWSTNNVTHTQQLTSSANNMLKQTSLVGMKPDIFAPNLIKKQNNNNLIDLNFFDSKENPKEKFSNVRTSVLEDFDPLLHGESHISSTEEEDQSIFL